MGDNLFKFSLRELRRRIEMPSKVMPLKQSMELLHKYRIPCAEYRIVKSLESALKAADRIGYPVAMKYLSKDIMHKTEVGAVKANIKDSEELKNTWEDMKTRLKGAKFQGMMVQDMAYGREIIIGGKRDKQFGPTVLFGLGGIFVEVLEDISVRVAPIRTRDAYEMMEEIRGYPVLAGARGEEPSDLEAIARTLVKVADMLDDHREIVEMDVNPLFVGKKGEGVRGVDFRIIVG
jgi:acyl-CoA synthetase (NDP forming)